MGTQGTPFELLMDLAMGVDRTWMEFGSCHGWNRKKVNQDNPNPWFAHDNKKYGPDRDISGHQLVEYALIHCGGCVAQYDCAKFAVRTRSDEGTSSMKISQMRWLQKQADWEEIIDLAEIETIPMSQAIVTVMRKRTAPDA